MAQEQRSEWLRGCTSPLQAHRLWRRSYSCLPHWLSLAAARVTRSCPPYIARLNCHCPGHLQWPTSYGAVVRLQSFLLTDSVTGCRSSAKATVCIIHSRSLLHPKSFFSWNHKWIHDFPWIHKWILIWILQQDTPWYIRIHSFSWNHARYHGFLTFLHGRDHIGKHV